MKNGKLIEAQLIDIELDGRKILDSISLELHSGQCVALLGESGAGKSTLLKILAGQLNADKGKVLYKGKVLRDPREQLIRGHREIKLVNQDFDLDLFHNVEENLRIKLVGYVENVKQDLIDEILDVVELKKFGKRQVRNLSGGEQQRLALARAIIQEPDVLLLDEPFVHLDSGLKMRIEHFIKSKIRLWESGVILVTHDGREAMTWADVVIYLNQGKIQRVDTPANFYNQPRNLNEALQFGHINVITVQKKKLMFRPNAYHICESDGLELNKVYSKFLGTHYEQWYVSPKKEEVLLYAHTDMPDKVLIQPLFVSSRN